MKAVIFKIKEGKLEAWKDWCKLLETDLRAQALETLKEEHISYESFILFEIKGEYFTIGMAEGEALPADTNKEINRNHKEIKKECLDKIGPIEVLYELYNKDYTSNT